MDRHSILDPNPAATAARGYLPDAGASGAPNAGVSAGIAANSVLASDHSQPGPAFPGEDGGQSLAEMAQNDLDAALQLLADRAQYITGASGAAIALRHAEHEDMLCRASAGCNAPELGARVSMEYGLSGESARTRRPLRCDDAESDPRVNREGCRRLGIASVVVMPIISEDQVLGVFELFSGKANAFGERDLSALQRLSEMVEMAVKQAIAAQASPIVDYANSAETLNPLDAGAVHDVMLDPPVNGPEPQLAPADAIQVPLPLDPENTGRDKAETEKANAEPPKRPLFWSATLPSSPSLQPTEEAEQSIAVPPVLRNLQKCQACGFPVSQGRTFCVECEEKQWKGQAFPQKQDATSKRQVSAQDTNSVHIQVAVPASSTLPSARLEDSTLSLLNSAASAAHNSGPSALNSEIPSGSTDSNSASFLGSAVSSESWFATNKYILSTLLLVAVVILLIAWLH